MAKVTIKTKSGAVITVEGTEKEVSNIVSIVEGTSQLRTQSVGHVPAPAPKRGQRKRFAAADLVLELREEGFFDKPKALGEVSSGLQEKGYLRPVTTLSGVMLGLVKRRIITRKKVGGKWVYGK